MESPRVTSVLLRNDLVVPASGAFFCSERYGGNVCLSQEYRASCRRRFEPPSPRFDSTDGVSCSIRDNPPKLWHRAFCSLPSCLNLFLLILSGFVPSRNEAHSGLLKKNHSSGSQAARTILLGSALSAIERQYLDEINALERQWGLSAEP